MAGMGGGSKRQIAAWHRCCFCGIMRELPGIFSGLLGRWLSSLVENEICFRTVADREGTLEVKPLVVLLLCINAAVAADHSLSEPWHWEVQTGSSNPNLCNLSPRVFLKASHGETHTPPLPLVRRGFFSDRQGLFLILKQNLGGEVSADLAAI